MRVDVGLASLERIDDLVGTLDKLTAAIKANTAAINANIAARGGILPEKPEPCGCGGACQLNGPRG